ncbi:hypothetical protein AVEN_21913-1 [Araneus ventricosus]|uniref:Uncharacterized protein n=1 Tax=Araneus ventricosus TaxID=182803 RepID=A0A4Y2D4V6_ARAVE|nr:hypothetical protein AVEN_21913-1 [Araneus ventricosus]
MSCSRIIKQELASPGGTKMVGGVLPPSSDNTYLLRERSGRGQVIGYQDSGLSTRAIAATVIQCSRMPRQDGVSLCVYLQSHRKQQEGWDGPHNFEPRSDDENDTYAGTLLSKLTRYTSGCKFHHHLWFNVQRAHMHNEVSVESDFEPGTLQPQDLTTRPKRLTPAIAGFMASVDHSPRPSPSGFFLNLSIFS